MENMVDREILSFVHRFIVRTIIRSVLSGLLIVPLCYTHLKRSTLFLVKQCLLYSLSRNDVWLNVARPRARVAQRNWKRNNEIAYYMLLNPLNVCVF